MTLDPNFITEANIITDDDGNFITSIFTPLDKIEVIKEINEQHKQLYGIDKDLIKIIDHEKEFMEECMEEYYNDEELQKLFNYDLEAYIENNREFFQEFYQKMQEISKKIKLEEDNQ